MDDLVRVVRWNPKTAVTAGLAVAAFAAANWVGEDLGAPVPGEIVPLLLVGGSAAALAAPRRSRLGRASAVLVILLAVAAGGLLGRLSARAAFNDCVARGEAVREALADHFAQTGAFPEALDELALHALPGERPLRGSLLAYRRTSGGYELSFSDWLVTHRASETEPFIAAK